MPLVRKAGSPDHWPISTAHSPGCVIGSISHVTQDDPMRTYHGTSAGITTSLVSVAATGGISL